jgi:glycosyltransferase involved in cell wall biosynthesis
MDFKPNYSTSMLLYSMSNDVAEAFKKIVGRDIVFVVAGKGSERLPRSAHFLPIGFIEKLADLLSLPDVIVLPHLSSYSGPHVKTSYAFLSGKSLVASEDATKDMPHVISGEHYLLVNPAVPSELVNALARLALDRSLYVRLTTNAYAYAKSNSWERIAMRQLSFYEAVLEGQ